MIDDNDYVELNLAVEMALLKSAKSGNFQAQSFWLRNRAPEMWSDKPAVHPVGGGGVMPELLALLQERREVDE